MSRSAAAVLRRSLAVRGFLSAAFVHDEQSRYQRIVKASGARVE